MFSRPPILHRLFSRPARSIMALLSIMTLPWLLFQNVTNSGLPRWFNELLHRYGVDDTTTLCSLVLTIIVIAIPCYVIGFAYDFVTHQGIFSRKTAEQKPAELSGIRRLIEKDLTSRQTIFARSEERR